MGELAVKVDGFEAGFAGADPRGEKMETKVDELQASVGQTQGRAAHIEGLLEGMAVLRRAAMMAPPPA